MHTVKERCTEAALVIACQSRVGIWFQALIKEQKHALLPYPGSVASYLGKWGLQHRYTQQGDESPLLSDQSHDQCNDQSWNCYSFSKYLLMTYNISTTVQGSEGETNVGKRPPLPSRDYSLDRDIMSTLAWL